MTPLLGGTDLLARAADHALTCLNAADGADRHGPTPCAGWDLRALLAHVNDSLLALHEAAAFGRVYPEVGDYAGADPVAVLRDRAVRLVGAWTPPAPRTEIALGDLALTAAIVTATGALELAVHGWDVARACGADGTIPDGLAAEMLDLAPLLVTAADRPSRFAVPLDPGAWPAPGDRLVALLGRHPRWTYR